MEREMKSERERDLDRLRDSEWEYERQMAVVCEQEDSLPTVPKQFTAKMLEGIYTNVEAYNKHAKEVIDEIEDNYSRYLYDSGQMDPQEKKKIDAAEDKRAKRAAKVLAITEKIADISDSLDNETKENKDD